MELPKLKDGLAVHFLEMASESKRLQRTHTELDGAGWQEIARLRAMCSWS